MTVKQHETTFISEGRTKTQMGTILRTCMLLTACLALATGCNNNGETKPSASANKTPTVYTSFYPTAYFAERIAGDHVKVVCPVPTDADPAFWMPDDKTLDEYQKADLIILNGASFESWPQKTSLPESHIVDTTKPLAIEFIVFAEAVRHSHGPGGEHAHEGIDGHTWVDPINAKTQAGEIHKALVKRYPAHKAAFDQGYAALANDLDKLDAKLKALSPRMKEFPVLASHPAYNYVARRYGWKVHSLHLDPEVVPTYAQLSDIQHHAKEMSAKLLIWEGEPTEAVAKALTKSLGIPFIVYSPCESLDEDEKKAGKDFVTVMLHNIECLEKALDAPTEGNN